MRRTTILLSLALAVSACEADAPAEDPEVREQREAAYRIACVSNELAQEAEQDLELLSSAFEAVTANTSRTEAERTTSFAALEFARAYQRHAELRAAVYAYLDSAVNHAATPSDSIRYMDRAGSFRVSTPVPGTVEANVMESYEAKMAGVLSDGDHPCNWDVPF